LFVLYQFDLFRVDVIAARADQILIAPVNLDVALIVDQAEIAGDAKTIFAQFLGGLFRHLPISLKDVRTTDLNLAYLPLRHLTTPHGIAYLQLHPRQRKSDGSRAAIPLVRV